MFVIGIIIISQCAQQFLARGALLDCLGGRSAQAVLSDLYCLFLSCRSRNFNGFQVEESGDNQNEFYGQAHTADQ